MAAPLAIGRPNGPNENREPREIHERNYFTVKIPVALWTMTIRMRMTMIPGTCTFFGYRGGNGNFDGNGRFIGEFEELEETSRGRARLRMASPRQAKYRGRGASFARKLRRAGEDDDEDDPRALLRMRIRVTMTIIPPFLGLRLVKNGVPGIGD